MNTINSNNGNQIAASSTWSEGLAAFRTGKQMHDNPYWPVNKGDRVRELQMAGWRNGWTFGHETEAGNEAMRLKALINSPELDQFLRGVHLEAVHQVERWGTATDRAKRPADWFWLVGYLGGKALHAAVAGDTNKALHHCISTAAALYNWHCAIKGVSVSMCPGRSDLAEVVDRSFPGEAA